MTVIKYCQIQRIYLFAIDPKMNLITEQFKAVDCAHSEICSSQRFGLLTQVKYTDCLQIIDVAEDLTPPLGINRKHTNRTKSALEKLENLKKFQQREFSAFELAIQN